MTNPGGIYVTNATYMVSVIEGPGGSAFWQERAGKTPLEAAWGYLRGDGDDSKATDLIRRAVRQNASDQIIICVVDKHVADNGQRWKVHLFEIFLSDEGRNGLIDGFRFDLREFF